MAISRRRRFAFVAITIVLVAALAELVSFVVYRVVVPSEVDERYRRLLDRDLGAGYFPFYRPHPYTCYELNPDFTDGAGVRWHGKDGFRLPEMPRERRPGVTRIVCMGGSTTYEPFVPTEVTWVAYLEEYLNHRFPGHPIEVLNAGVGAYNSADTFARFHYKVLDYSPDMVVNYDGINDVWPRLCPGPFENDLRNARTVMKDVSPPGALSTALARRSWTYRLLYYGIGLRGRIPSIMELTYQPFELREDVLARNGTSAFRRNLEDTAAICKARGIELVLSTCATDPFVYGRDPKKNPYALLVLGTEEQNEVVKAIARDRDVALVDFAALMERNDLAAPAEQRTFVDVCHTTTRGNRIKANVFGAAIAKLLEKKLGPSVPFEHDVAPKSGYPPAKLDR